MMTVEARGKPGIGLDRRPANVGHPLTWATALLLAWVAASVRAESGPAQPPRAAPDGNTAVLEPVRMPTKSRKSRTIFACRSGALVEFSDRPCDTAATSRSLEFTTGTGPGATPSTRPREPVASTRPKVSAPPTDAVPDARDARDARDDEAQRKKCTTLQGQLDAVDSRMREGYGARDAARLWNRWRELKEEIRTSAC